MRKATGVMFLLVMIFASSHARGTGLDEYISKAKSLQEAGDIAQAVELLEKAVADHPESSEIYAYLGLYTGMSAGQEGDYMEAGRLSFLAFERLDTAVSLDPDNPTAYLFRGILGVRVPKFLGRLDGGIADLKRVLALHAKDSNAVPIESLVYAHQVLAEGHTKNEDPAAAKEVLQKIIQIAPGTDAAKNAEEQIAKLPSQKAPERSPLAASEDDSPDIASLKKRIENDPGDSALVLALGEAYYNAGEFDGAVEVLKWYVRTDTSNPTAYRLLGISTARLAEHGYDEKIYSDTDYRSGLAFEAISYMDRAIELAPDDVETRLIRGIFGIMFPFFVGKHDQGVGDLEYVVKSDATESQKAEALYYLGVAHQRKAMRYWLEVATEYPQTDATNMVYQEMRPVVQHFDPAEHEKPVIAIDFVLGFQDELPPQTAVWIEDGEGNAIRTLYVSGFSGYAKEKQINLPVWSAVSGFEDIDDVTGASIDIGHHIYTWDLRDGHGKRVENGKYTVKVEVSHWPSMKYQLAEAVVQVGKKNSEAVVEEGAFIPQLRVTYYNR
jgi:tetratricopeptide (TPR) repeat protein